MANMPTDSNVFVPAEGTMTPQLLIEAKLLSLVVHAYCNASIVGVEASKLPGITPEAFQPVFAHGMQVFMHHVMTLYPDGSECLWDLIEFAKSRGLICIFAMPDEVQ